MFWNCTSDDEFTDPALSGCFSLPSLLSTRCLVIKTMDLFVWILGFSRMPPDLSRCIMGESIGLGFWARLLTFLGRDVLIAFSDSFNWPGVVLAIFMLRCGPELKFLYTGLSRTR